MFNIDARSSTPIYEQIMGQIKEAIMRGLLEPGEKLPSVREMSTLLTVNPNTVSKAYQELEREKAIETIRAGEPLLLRITNPGWMRRECRVLKTR